MLAGKQREGERERERESVDKQQNSCAQFHPKLITPTVVKIEYHIEYSLVDFACIDFGWVFSKLPQLKLCTFIYNVDNLNWSD